MFAERLGNRACRERHPDATDDQRSDREWKRCKRYFGLTKKAAIDAGVKQVDIWKVRSGRAAHFLIAQSETILAKRGKVGINQEWAFEAYEVESQEVGATICPDVVWHFRNRNNAASTSMNVEVELSGKDGRELDQFYFKLLFAKDVSLVVFEGEELLQRYVSYAQRYKAIGAMPIWKKTNGEWWKLESLEPIPGSRWDRIYFRVAGRHGMPQLSKLILDLPKK